MDEKAGLIEKDNGFIDGLNGHISHEGWKDGIAPFKKSEV